MTILDARQVTGLGAVPGALVEAISTELQAGRCVALPTDTVYGLAASLASVAAIRELSVLKGRPAALPIAVLVADLAQAEEVAVLDGEARVLAERHWPGALTLVLGGRQGVGPTVGAVDGSVGVRCPDHPLVRAVAAAVGPLATTSANLHGEGPATTATEVAARFPTVGVVVDGGGCHGVPSTVVDARFEPPRILRQGGLDLA